MVKFFLVKQFNFVLLAYFNILEANEMFSECCHFICLVFKYND